MPQVGVDTLDREGIIFVVNVSHVLSRINHVNVARPAVRAVIFSLRRAVHNGLNALRRLVERSVYPDNLSWQAADHGDNVSVFAGSLSLDEVIQLIKF